MRVCKLVHEQIQLRLTGYRLAAEVNRQHSECVCIYKIYTHTPSAADSLRPRDGTQCCGYTANTRYWAIVGSMLAHRLRRWPTIDPAMGQCLVLAGMDPHLSSIGSRLVYWVLEVCEERRPCDGEYAHFIEFSTIRCHGLANLQADDIARRQHISIPANTTHWNSVGLMLAHRLRRWPNIKPTSFQCVVLARIRFSTNLKQN